MSLDTTRRDNQPARIDPIRAGLLCRCPHCGDAPLFSGFLKVRPVCEGCGFDLAAIETGDGPATFIMQITGFVVAFSALYVEIAFRPPMWLHLIIWLPMVAGLALALMRPGKGLMTALEYRKRIEVDPRGPGGSLEAAVPRAGPLHHPSDGSPPPTGEE